MDKVYIKVMKFIDIYELIARDIQTEHAECEWLGKLTEHELRTINKIIDDYNKGHTSQHVNMSYRHSFIFAYLRRKINEEYHILKDSLQLIKRVRNGNGK